MTTNEPAWVPDCVQLAANLRHLRRLPDRRTPRFEGVAELMRVAERLCPDEAGSIERLLAVVQRAVDHPRAAAWAKTALLLYGLTTKSRGKPLSARRQLAFAASNEDRLQTWRTAREYEMASDLAVALIELVAESHTDGSAATSDIFQYPLPAHAAIMPNALDQNDRAIKVVTGVILLELQAMCKEGVEQALGERQIQTLISLAEAVVGGSGTMLQQVERLFMWAIHESESDDGRRYGVAALFGLGPYRGATWAERRADARRFLSVNNDTKQKPYRPGEEEGRVIPKLAKPLSALAAQEQLSV